MRFKTVKKVAIAEMCIRDRFIRDYVRGLAIERAAVDGLRKEPIN